MKYIVTGVRTGPFGTDTRPTQESFKGFGEGRYDLRRGDGSISKIIEVVVNRNGNLKVEASNPDGIDGLSTIVLNRLVRAYGPIVKHLPKSPSARDYKRVVDEVQARATLVGTVAPQQQLDLGPIESKVIIDIATGEEIEAEIVDLEADVTDVAS